MSQILSIFFNTDRAYLASFIKGAKGLSLEFINSTSKPVDLENSNQDTLNKFVAEIDKLITPIKDNITSVDICFAAENVIISQFPGIRILNNDDLKKMVSLEIKQTYPHFNFSDFKSLVIPLSIRMDGKKMMLAEIISNKMIESANYIVEQLGFSEPSYDVSQFNAHNAVLYNYPEHKDKTVALLGIQNQFIDISVLKNGEPLYYNLLNFNDKTQLAKHCEEEFNQIMSHYVDYVEIAFFFGAGLTSDMYNAASEVLAGFLMTSVKLNAFRMITTSLGKREREYCARTAHIFPPSIGGVLPAYHEKIYF